MRVQPVFFFGVQWGSPGKKGGQRHWTIDVKARAAELRQSLPEHEVPDPLVYDSAEETATLSADVAEADLVVVGQSELLAIPWAAAALVKLDKPIVLYCRDGYLSAPLTDLAGTLSADR